MFRVFGVRILSEGLGVSIRISRLQGFKFREVKDSCTSHLVWFWFCHGGKVSFLGFHVGQNTTQELLPQGTIVGIFRPYYRHINELLL